VIAAVRYDAFDPLVTRPYTSTVTLLYVDAPTPVVYRSNTGLIAVPVLMIRFVVPVADETLLLKVLQSVDVRTPVAVELACGIEVVETDDTRPSASVVIVGITSDEPYVPAVPTAGIEIDVDPPSATVAPPVNPVPAETVIDELASCVFAMLAVAERFAVVKLAIVVAPEAVSLPF
jgi:hypothetical protein